jgi:hypothetical protein
VPQFLICGGLQHELLIVNRLLRDDPSKGDMNNRQAVGPMLLWKALKDWEQWPLYIVGLLKYVPHHVRYRIQT